MTSMRTVDEPAGHDNPASSSLPPTPQTEGSRKSRRSILQAGRRTPLPKHFGWRLVLLRFLVNAVALAITVGITPQVFFVGDYRILTWLAISAVFGLLNAFVKPIVQVVLLPFMFLSYGLVVVLINAVMLWLLDWIFVDRFQVGHIGWALLAGAVFGIIAGFMENMLGLTPPIFEGEPKALKHEIDRRAHNSVEARILYAAHGARAAETPTPDAGAGAEPAEEGAESAEEEAAPPAHADAQEPPAGASEEPPAAPLSETAANPPSGLESLPSEDVTLVIPAHLVRPGGPAAPGPGPGGPAVGPAKVEPPAPEPGASRPGSVDPATGRPKADER